MRLSTTESASLCPIDLCRTIASGPDAEVRIAFAFGHQFKTLLSSADLMSEKASRCDAVADP